MERSEDLMAVKRRFGIVGNHPLLHHAIEKAMRIARADISVLITGESGVGKETIPKIIHEHSVRKHNLYFSINCGAIPEGTIDSELFGHEKGAFTGASSSRKGYFEVADGGTLFLDEVGELPLASQAKLLRVLENGEFIRVGDSKVLRTNVRVIAATNVAMIEAVKKKKFREDLFYRLATAEIFLPPLREREQDVLMLFHKFASDFAEKYRIPSVSLTEGASHALVHYHWPGNIRQLKNFAEQVSLVETNRTIDHYTVAKYLPDFETKPTIVSDDGGYSGSGAYGGDASVHQMLFEIKKDIHELKSVLAQLIRPMQASDPHSASPSLPLLSYTQPDAYSATHSTIEAKEQTADDFSLEQQEIETIKRALEKNQGRRKETAVALGISERTLYRKIKQYNLE